MHIKGIYYVLVGKVCYNKDPMEEIYMKKIYLIPVGDQNIYCGDKSLKNILKESYPELFQREEHRLEILRSVHSVHSMSDFMRRRYITYAYETMKLFDRMRVPEYLIAVETEDGVREILTGVELESHFPIALMVRDIGREDVEKYYVKTDYEEKVMNYFKAMECNFGVHESPVASGFVKMKK